MSEISRDEQAPGTELPHRAEGDPPFGEADHIGEPVEPAVTDAADDPALSARSPAETTEPEEPEAGDWTGRSTDAADHQEPVEPEAAPDAEPVEVGWRDGREPYYRSDNRAPGLVEESEESEEPVEASEPALVATETDEDGSETAEPEGGEGAGDTVAASADDIPLQGQLMDRMKSVFGRDGADQVREISNVVDKPDFQVPEKMYPPDRYGTPLDRPDGTRTPLFDGVPTREQTKQGELGDCGFIATLGAVAGHRPQDIMNSVKESEDGNYEVLLHEAKGVGSGRYEPTGNVVRLTVSPDLPVHDEIPDRPAFADSVDTGVAWAPILEKAIAGLDQTWSEERGASWTRAHNRPDDLRAGYVRLDDGTKSGERAEFLVQLTGQPAETWDLPKSYDHEGRSVKRQVMDHFVEKLDSGCPIVVGTRKPSKEEAPLTNDLVGGHAYEVTDVDDRGFIHLRNPYNREDPRPLTFEEFKKNCLPLYTTLDPK